MDAVIYAVTSRAVSPAKELLIHPVKSRSSQGDVGNSGPTTSARAPDIRYFGRRECGRLGSSTGI